MVDTWEDGLLERACEIAKDTFPDAVWYLKKQVMRRGVTPTGREARTASLIGALGVIEPKSLKARYGYHRPGITIKEIIEKGLIYFISGEKLANQKKAQAWVFWDEYASLKTIINKRTPHNDDDVPVLFVADEVYQLFEIKGMAKELGLITAYYRSRKLQPVYIIQAHWQLAEILKDQMWNIGNLVTFSMDNIDDTYRFSQQVIKYDETRSKQVIDSDQPIVETDRGQYLQAANWIQNLGWREMVMRRYINEQDKEPFIVFVKRTREKPRVRLPERLDLLKKRLFRRRAIKVEAALEVVEKRDIKRESKRKSKGRRDINQP